MLSKDGRQVGGLFALAPETPRDGASVPRWQSYIAVADADDCDATVAQAHDLGARLASPVTDLPRIGRFAGLTDP